MYKVMQHNWRFGIHLDTSILCTMDGPDVYVRAQYDL